MRAAASSRSAWKTMAGRPQAHCLSRNARKRHDLVVLACHFRDRVHLHKKSTTWSPAYINEAKTPAIFFVKQVQKQVPMSPRQKKTTGGVTPSDPGTQIQVPIAPSAPWRRPGAYMRSNGPYCARRPPESPVMANVVAGLWPIVRPCGARAPASARATTARQGGP